ncbi:formate--tetrahydrofolate ligase [Reinekea blandensis]|uniref:Formate--tetrahydrofolate ligase n=1 Tax=Reinekea blandensis MED297 TaxID=314283 RepID=A4BGV2_9GAMM|nr:formate--tetrahydrofolate ligase [Reinekea blandensis]EAR08598.1 formate-tetrahydrofolate ligase [Reinekea sp. MED297] [Reinekea blandensis MED297]
MSDRRQQHSHPLSDLEIARQATMQRILPLAQTRLGIPEDQLEPYGHYKAKVSLDYLNTLDNRPNGRLILVTAISPTASGEGKTTTTVGLTDAFNALGTMTMACLREPSLGPCFGMKGGAAGGGYAQVVPMEDINLHFTGDLHAIGAANNLLAAMIDNHINWHQNDESGLDNRRITWRRVLDISDRSLREVITSLGGVGNGAPREGGFDITVASEVMAILCLATDLKDLERRLGNIIVGYNRKSEPITARDIQAHGAMTVLLKDAMKPNLVQTLENNPVLVHGGPFANIAHGCNSLVATQAALKLADVVVTEAGFGADLGAEKFFNIKCRKGALQPELAVLVATIRALKLHGGATADTLDQENLTALAKGFSNLARHVDNLRRFNVDVIVAINRFSSDTEKERSELMDYCRELGVQAIETDHWAQGSQGAVNLANACLTALSETTPDRFKTLYPDDMFLWNKISMIATELYGASEIVADQKVRDQIRSYQAHYGHFPICMAKTQYSFSTDPHLKGAPNHHVVPIREVRLSAGAEFLVVICGDIMTMPGLPKTPAANQIGLDEDGQIIGLF